MVGAAGATGGGLARAILADPEGGYACRAITRTPDSAAARALADQGATVVRADLDDVDSLVAAFEGAYGAFCLTSFFEHFDAEREAHPGRQPGPGRRGRRRPPRDLVDRGGHPAAVPARRRPDADAAGPVQGAAVGREVRGRRALRRTPVSPRRTCSRPSTGRPGCSASVLRSPDRTACSPSAMPLGDALLPGIAAEDIGRCAYGVFRGGEEFIGKTIGIAGEHITGERLAAGLARGVRRAGALPVAAAGGVPLAASSPASRSRPTCSSTWPRPTTTTAGAVMSHWRGR